MSYSHVSILCIAESCSTIQMCYILLPYSSNGSDFLVIRTNAEVSVGAQVSVRVYFQCFAFVCECDVCVFAHV